MRLDDYRWSALARYHDSAMESAVVLLAIARRPVHSHFDLHLQPVTGVRSHIRTMTEMQTFAINSRKSLEIANLVIPGIVDRAKSTMVHSSGETFGTIGAKETTPLCDSSFWWVVSRIVHSVRTVVLSEDEFLGATAMRIYSQRRDTIFGFASDFDGASARPSGYMVAVQRTHYVRVESLVSIYGGLGLKIDEAIAALRPPLKIPAC